jgi:hypothetical protein
VTDQKHSPNRVVDLPKELQDRAYRSTVESLCVQGWTVPLAGFDAELGGGASSDGGGTHYLVGDLLDMAEKATHQLCSANPPPSERALVI